MLIILYLATTNIVIKWLRFYDTRDKLGVVIAFIKYLFCSGLVLFYFNNKDYELWFWFFWDSLFYVILSLTILDFFKGIWMLICEKLGYLRRDKYFDERDQQEYWYDRNQRKYLKVDRRFGEWDQREYLNDWDPGKYLKVDKRFGEWDQREYLNDWNKKKYLK